MGDVENDRSIFKEPNMSTLLCKTMYNSKYKIVLSAYLNGLYSTVKAIKV